MAHIQDISEQPNLLSKEQLQQLKEHGGFLEFTFPNLFDHIKLVGNKLYLKPNIPTIDSNFDNRMKAAAEDQEKIYNMHMNTIDIEYTEVEQRKLNA